MKKFTLSLLAGVAALGYASAGYAADLIVETPIVEPGIVDVGGNWDGAYVGIFAGYGWGDVDHTGVLPGLFDDPGADLDIDGWLLGVKAGADFTVGSGVVVGVVGDLAWSSQSGEGTFDDTNFGVDFADVTYELDWQGSVRGRVGFDAEAFLPYLTAGLAFGHFNHTISLEGDPAEEGDATYIGWTAGAGVEFAVADNATLNLEYRYTDFGEQTIDMGLGANDPSFAITSHAITAGVNWRF
jgi:outer membrane immunogenic protein